MSEPTSSDPDGAGPGAIRDELDEMEERVVGRRVDPPPSDDLGEEAGADQPEPSG